MSPMQTASSRGRRRFAGCVLLLLFLLPHAPPSLSILLLFSVATPATCQRAREPESRSGYLLPDSHGTAMLVTRLPRCNDSQQQWWGTERPW